MPPTPIGGSEGPGLGLGLGVGGGVGRPLNVDNVLFSRRFGSVQPQVKLGPICGSASARISMITPLVRLISSSAVKIPGFCCNAVITAWSILKTGDPFSDQPRLLAPKAAA